MSKTFLTLSDIESKLEISELHMFDTNYHQYLTKSEVKSKYSSEDYNEDVLNNVDSDNKFVTDDDIVKSPRYALTLNFLDEHVQSVKITVSNGISLNASSQDNNISTYANISIGGGSLSDTSNFIKIGTSKTVTGTTTVYIPKGARVTVSDTYDEGYQAQIMYSIIQSMDKDYTYNFISKPTSTTHTHTGYSGTVNVSFKKHNSNDSFSYSVYHTYNNATCTINYGNITSTSQSFSTVTSDITEIIFIPHISSSLDQILKTYTMSITSSTNVNAIVFNSTSGTDVATVGLKLRLSNIQANWSVNVYIS